MRHTPHTVIGAVHDLNNDQEIGIYRLTPNGKDALRDTVAELTQGVQSWSQRQATNASEFLLEIEPEINQMINQKTALKQLIQEMHDTDGAQEDLQSRYFELEAQINQLSARVFNKQPRIQPIIDDLMDPVGSFSRAQTKFPTLRKPYLAAFGK